MSLIITGVIGVALLAVFLSIYVFWVKAVPLIIIIVGVMALLIYDFWQEVRSQANGPYRR
jgi:hypothetical protein